MVNVNKAIGILYVGGLIKERDAARAEAARLRAALVQAKDALIWCGGSYDFSLRGQAYKGWLAIVVPAIAAIDAALEEK